MVRERIKIISSHEIILSKVEFLRAVKNISV